MARKVSIASRMGFFFVAIGSAGGLGNLWRFPHIVGQNGGGAFVFLYLFLVVILGLPLLIGELILGKSTGRSVLSALGTLPIGHRPRWMMMGWLSVLLCGMILAYYSVISGWVLHFSMRFLMSLVQVQDPQNAIGLSSLLRNGWMQAALASVHILICIFVVAKGVQEGLEKFISWTLPLFAGLLLILVLRSLSLPSSGDALRFLFYPDFSKLNVHSWASAVGQVLFTLSLGFGTMVTFGSYMGPDDIPAAGLRVAFFDTLISLLSGLLIFPIVLQAQNISVGDPGLLFEALPRFLVDSQGGLLFGFAFFVCLYLASLGASIGLLEVIVANWVDQRKSSRSVAAWSMGAAVFGFSLIPAFSSSAWSQVQLQSRSLIQILDLVIINWALPLLALGFSVAVTRGVSREEKQRLFRVGEGATENVVLESEFLFPYWRMALRWVVPGVIGLGLLLEIGDWLMNLFKS